MKYNRSLIMFMCVKHESGTSMLSVQVLSKYTLTLVQAYTHTVADKLTLRYLK